MNSAQRVSFSKTRIGILAVSLVGMAALAITPSYAAIAKFFSLNNTSVQMLTSLPNLFMMLAGIIIGKLTANKVNLKMLTLTSILLVTIGGLLPLVLHTNFAFLLFCSCLVGLGQGACTNLTQVLIAQFLPQSERESTMGYLQLLLILAAWSLLWAEFNWQLQATGLIIIGYICFRC
ncbi:MFS transporter [uncultured Lactobacillus sp.]|uniref:MFS transporter n=1 Tax=uncultured Lactobacillus sp. TaxID=153152 RepID=UPI0025E53FFD|nr:MFS transporter [uncultured Lactobacillus sp.]